MAKQKRIRLWTAVWGEKHIEWFKAACLNSLCWPKNAEALEDAIWTIVTKGDQRELIEALIKASPLKLKNIEFIILGPELDQNPHAAGIFMNQAWQLYMGQCITFDERCFMAPPDTITGDGSIAHLKELSTQRDTVVLAAHMRVTPEILGEIRSEPGNRTALSNSKLVSLGIKHAHATWAHAEVGLEKVNSYVGGISWRYLSENLYSVTHRLPTPYMINFTPEDLVYFRNQLHFGVLDHDWPAECLIDTERQRLVGSSDGAFFVEITEIDSNIPPTSAYHEDEADLFWRKKKHNAINRMTSIIFRGEP